MKLTGSSIARVSSCLLETGAKKATLFLGVDFVVRAVMGLKPRKNARSQSFLVTFGRPNFAERKFIAACIRAGEPLPVRKVQLKYFK